MQTFTLTSLLLIAGLSHAQRFPNYVQFQGNSSSPKSVPPGVRDTLQQADTSPNASHTVSFSSPGYGDWDWTLQLSDVSVPAISNSTPDAHVAFTTWHFSQAGEEPMLFKRVKTWPFCAYLMDINFPYNVSSQWDSDNSSCIPALGEKCASVLGNVAMSSDCNSSYVDILGAIDEDACAGMLGGGPAETIGIGTQGYAFNARVSESDEAWGYAITKPYEGFNETAFQVEAERLRIMVFSGREGSELVCNRVAETVEIGASSRSSRVGGLAIMVVVSPMLACWL